MSALTVQVTLSDSLHVFSVDELVASLPDDVDWGQVHVVADSVEWNETKFFKIFKIYSTFNVYSIMGETKKTTNKKLKFGTILAQYTKKSSTCDCL